MRRSIPRWIGSAILLVSVGGGPGFAFRGASAQQRDAATVIAEMRQALGAPAALDAITAQGHAQAILKAMRDALGGEAALDGVKSFSLETRGSVSVQGRSVSINDEYYFVLPDRYLRVRELRGASMRVFEGFRGAQLIRRASHDGGKTSALAEGDRLTLARWRHDAARFVLALMGTSLPTYPLEFSVVGREDAGGIVYDVVEAAGDGIRMRLHVDTLTHLPAMVTTRGLERSPEIRWLLSKFKRTGPLNWPTQIEEQADGLMDEEVTVRRWKINPATDARTFDPR